MHMPTGRLITHIRRLVVRALSCKLQPTPRPRGTSAASRHSEASPCICGVCHPSANRFGSVPDLFRSTCVAVQRPPPVAPRAGPRKGPEGARVGASRLSCSAHAITGRQTIPESIVHQCTSVNLDPVAQPIAVRRLELSRLSRRAEPCTGHACSTGARLCQCNGLTTQVLGLTFQW